MKEYKVIDLFAGAGGLSLGFKQAGSFRIVAAAENNENAKKTYHENHTNTDLYDDIRGIHFSELSQKYGAIDVVIGGPPCQGFSNANRQKAKTISLNNGLVKQFVRAITELQPTVFVMENVGMLKSDTHRFYYSQEDVEDIEKLGIKLRDDDLLLLPPGFYSEDYAALIGTLEYYEECLWDAVDYLVLNVLFRQRRNHTKLKKAAIKYERRINDFSKKYSVLQGPASVAGKANKKLAEALQAYVHGEMTEDSLISIIEPAIMLQRMYMRYQELIDNRIIVNEIIAQKGIVAHVSSFSVLDYIRKTLGAKPYCYNIKDGVLNAADFGAPQKRERFILVGTKNGTAAALPKGTYEEKSYRTVADAIQDLETVPTYFNVTTGARALPTLEAEPGSLISLLRDSTELYNHIITETQAVAKERFAALHPGDNFHSLADELKSSYTDAKRTQNTIYLRLNYNKPSGTVVNVRKSMWVHPKLDRALSIREAARLQTFPDSFRFIGTKDSQYQQVGNAVPPMLAKAIAEQVLSLLHQGETHGG